MVAHLLVVRRNFLSPGLYGTCANRKKRVMPKRPRSSKPIFRGLDFEDKACKRKKRFASEGEARMRAAYLQSLYPDESAKSTYACEFCGGWHLATVNVG